ncbi:hypothetical protein CVT26_013629, partial [Gymnopilus dilepis]
MKGQKGRRENTRTLRLMYRNYKPKKDQENFDPFVSGGLGDEDALSTRPPFPRAPATQDVRIQIHQEADNKDLNRDLNRKNEVGHCQHHCISLITGYTQLVKVDIEGEGRGAATEVSVKSSRRLSDDATTIFKKSRRAARATALDSAVTPTTTNSQSSEKFLKDRHWARPFKHFTADSPEFLATVQHVFNCAFPDVSFTLSSNDKLTTTPQRIAGNDVNTPPRESFLAKNSRLVATIYIMKTRQLPWN